MSGPGRPSKPSNLKILQGERRPSRLNAYEPSAEPGEAQAPGHLGPDAAAVWALLAPELERSGLLAPRYGIAFEVLCDAIVNYRRAQAIVTKAGPLIRGKETEVVSNPASREARHWGLLLHRYAVEFGLTPSAVASIGRAMGNSREEPRTPARLLS